MKLLWILLLVLLIPIWVTLIIFSIIGEFCGWAWKKLYDPLYEKAGSPLDSNHD